MFSQSQEEVKLEWMYKGAHSTVDREEYLLGRSIDKTLEQLNAEEKQQQLGILPPKNHVEHECIPPSIRDYKLQADDQVDLAAKLQEDPLIAIKKREEENRRQFLNNPIQIKKLQKALKIQKKKKHKQKNSGSDSDEDLNVKLAKKLKLLKQNPVALEYNRKPAKKSKEDDVLNTILMHKYNELKSKLSDDDLRDILQGKADDSSSGSEQEDEKDCKKLKEKYTKKRSRSSSSDSSNSGDEDQRKKQNVKHKKNMEQQTRRRSRSSSNEEKFRRKIQYSSREKGEYKNKSRRSRSRSNDREKYRLERRNDSRERKESSISKEREQYRSVRNYNKEKKEPKERRASSANRDEERYKNQKYITRRDNDRSYKSGTNKRNHDSPSKEKYTKRDNRYNKEAKKYSVEGRKSRKDSSSSDEVQKVKQARNNRYDDKNKTKNNSAQSRKSRRNSSSSDEEVQKGKQKIYTSKSHIRRHVKSDESNDDNSKIKTNYHSSSSSESEDSDGNVKKKKKTWGLVRADGTKLPLVKKQSNESTNKPENTKVEETKVSDFRKRRKLTEEEKEKIRREMMENAMWRDSERVKNVKRYREKDSQEDQKPKDYDPEFLKKELLKSANTSSVESRIKANINNIQRSGSDMNRHFSKR